MAEEGMDQLDRAEEEGDDVEAHQFDQMDRAAAPDQMDQMDRAAAPDQMDQMD
jgi:hypothetical protein